MSAKTRLLLLVVFGGHAFLFAGCKAKCLHGYVMEGKSCRKIVSDGGASPSDAGDADAASSPDAATSISVDNRTKSPDEDAAVKVTAAPSNKDAGTKKVSDAGKSPDTGIGTSSSANQVEPEACDVAGATRCSAQSAQRSREICKDKVWTSGEPCAASETCVMGQDGASCAAIEALCVGSDGKPVCDAQGQLLLCNEDGTVRSQEMCASVSYCQAGIAASKCPLCLANEFRCTGASLEICAEDGMSFTAHMACPSAALCSARLGMCSAAVCLPGTFTCESNVLKTCKADSSGFDDASAMACGARTCDAEGGDCNMCQPGAKSCMGSSVTTCDATGQRLDPAPCAGGMKCIGAGQCVACSEDSDCGSLTADCKVGACEQYRCVSKNAPSGRACTTGGRPGTCGSGGECRCTPQCDKPCGANGCGAQCPNTCGSLMCVEDACVECTRASQCAGSADGCQVGVCSSDGQCGLSSAGTDGDACRVNNMDGMCSGGQCVAAPPPPPPPPPTTEQWTACNDPGGSCSGPSDLCHLNARYCVPPCGANSCAGTRSCLDGWCLIVPPSCPAGLSEIEIPAYTPTGKALICAVPGGI